MVHRHCLYSLAIAQDIPAGSHMIAVHYDVVAVLPLRALIKIISEDALRKAHTLPMQTAVATVCTSLVSIISETSKTNFRKSNKADIDAYCYLTDTLSIVQELTSVVPFLELKADGRIHIIYDKFPKENSMNNYRKKQ